MQFELPPTAGLPINLGDLRNTKHYSLDTQIAQLLSIPLPAQTCSGTVAFILSLQILQELQPNKNQVIVPAWTCPLVVLAIEKIGLIPIICDLAPNSLAFDLQQLKYAIHNQTLAIVATHFAGLVNSFKEIELIAKQYNCYIIEDAAQSMGALSKGQSVGLQGDIGFFSLAFGKGLTTAEGGLVFSKHPEIHQKLHQKAKQLPTLKYWEIKRCLELIGYYFLYRPSCLPFIYGYSRRKALKRHDEISAVGDDFNLNDIPIHRLGSWRSQVAAQAAIRLPEQWKQLRSQAKRRIKQLQNIPYLYVFTEDINSVGTFPFILLLVDNALRCEKILAELWHSNLGVTKLFVRSISHYPNLAHFNTRTTPHAEQFAARSFTISNSLWMNDAKFEQILNILKKYEY